MCSRWQLQYSETGLYFVCRSVAYNWKIDLINGDHVCERDEDCMSMWFGSFSERMFCFLGLKSLPKCRTANCVLAFGFRKIFFCRVQKDSDKKTVLVKCKCDIAEWYKSSLRNCKMHLLKTRLWVLVTKCFSLYLRVRQTLIFTQMKINFEQWLQWKNCCKCVREYFLTWCLPERYQRVVWWPVCRPKAYVVFQRMWYQDACEPFIRCEILALWTCALFLQAGRSFDSSSRQNSCFRQNSHQCQLSFSSGYILCKVARLGEKPQIRRFFSESVSVSFASQSPTVRTSSHGSGTRSGIRSAWTRSRVLSFTPDKPHWQSKLKLVEVCPHQTRIWPTNFVQEVYAHILVIYPYLYSQL